jgi:hypothetical protein
VSFEMDEVLANLLGADELGRAIIILAELAHAGQVGLDGARADGQEGQIIGEAIKDGVRGTFFICMGVWIEVNG